MPVSLLLRELSPSQAINLSDSCPPHTERVGGQQCVGSGVTGNHRIHRC